MVFHARIRPLSYTSRRWKGEGKTGGLINGVKFRWDGRCYMTQELDEGQVAALEHQGHVELIMTEISIVRSVRPDPGHEVQVQNADRPVEAAAEDAAEPVGDADVEATSDEADLDDEDAAAEVEPPELPMPPAPPVPEPPQPPVMRRPQVNKPVSLSQLSRHPTKGRRK